MITEILMVFAGAVSVLFIPGYSLTRLLFKNGKIDIIEKIVLSIGLSIASIPLIFFYLVFLFGIKINLINLIVIIVLIAAPSFIILPPQIPNKINKERFYGFLIFMSFIMMALGIGYYPYLQHNYILLPSYDPIFHIGFTKQILESGGDAIKNCQYCPGLHILTATLSKSTGLNILDTGRLFFSSFLALSALAIFVFVRRNFGLFPSLFGIFIWIFFSTRIITWLWGACGTFPNILTYAFLFVLGIHFFIKSYESRNLNDIIVTSLLFSAIALFHSSFSYLVILLLATPLFLLFDFLNNNNIHKKITTLFLIVVITLLLGSLPIYEFQVKGQIIGTAVNLVKSQIEGTLEIPDSRKMYPLRLNDLSYYTLFGEAVLYLGLLGALMLFWKIPRIHRFYQRNIKNRTAYAIILLIVWIFMFFLFSKFYILGYFSGRILIDLSLPLSICAGIFLFIILKHTYLFFMSGEYPSFIKALIKKIPLKGIYMITILLILLCSGWYTNLYLQDKQEAYIYITTLDYDAGIWVKNNIPENETILTGNYATLPLFVSENRKLILAMQPYGVCLYNLSYRYQKYVGDANYSYMHIDTQKARKILLEYNISYIYDERNPSQPLQKKVDGRKIYYNKEEINEYFSFREKLKNQSFLTPVKTFKEGGEREIIIYKVDKQLLYELTYNDTIT